jgi:glutathione S-transferase
MKHAPPPRGQSGYGDFDEMMGVIGGAISPGPYLLGSRFSAADILWSIALSWTIQFGMVPPTQAIRAYIDRVEGSRPSFNDVRASDAALAAEHEKAASGS